LENKLRYVIEFYENSIFFHLNEQTESCFSQSATLHDILQGEAVHNALCLGHKALPNTEGRLPAAPPQHCGTGLSSNASISKH
jgi:hypothetical protein